MVAGYRPAPARRACGPPPRPVRAKELSEAGRSVVAALTAMAADPKDWRTRLRALWTLDGIDAIEPATVVRALEDPSRDVRVAAIRLAERWLGEPASPIRAAVLSVWTTRTMPCGGSWRRRSARCRRSDRDGAVVTLLERHAGDPITLDAALSGLHGSEADVLERLLASDGADAAAGCRRHDARGDDRPQQRGRRRPAAVRLDRRREPAAVAAVRAAARGGGRAAGCDDAGNATAECRSGAGGDAVPDLSWREGRAGRCVRVLEGGRLRARRSPRRPRRPGRAAREKRAGGVVSAGGKRRRAGLARGERARARELAGEARGDGDDAADGRRAAAVRRGTRGLPQHLPGLPPARRPRPGSRGAEPRRLAACCLRRPASRLASC